MFFWFKFVIAPTENFLLVGNQKNYENVIIKIDKTTIKLSDTEKNELYAPLCWVFSPIKC